MASVYGAIDLQKNELRNAVIQNLAGAPASPAKGQMYFNSTGGDNTLYWWDGTAWIPAKASSNLPLSSSASTLVVGGAAVGGAASDASRGDHVHALPNWGSSTAETAFGGTKADGVAGTFARSDHGHGTPTHDGVAHAAIPLSSLAAPTTAVDFNFMRLANVGNPQNPTDGANKSYVDLTVQGLDQKQSVTVATTANITLSGTQTIDTIGVLVGNRVLVKNQTTASQNGIYVVAAGAWTRATDFDETVEIPSAYTWVEMGATQADTGWVCTNDSTATMGVTAITWVQFSGAGQITAGAGLTKSGNTIDAVAGDTSLTVAADSIVVNTAVIATVASLAAKADTATVLTAGAGLTGGGSLAANRTLDVGAGTGITVAADTVAVDTSVIATRAYADAAIPPGVAKKFAAALTGTASPEVVTHSLNTRDISLTVLNGASPYTAVEVDWDATSLTTATIRYSPNLGTGYRVVVMG